MEVEPPSALSPSNSTIIVIQDDDDDEYSGHVVAVGPGLTENDGSKLLPSCKPGDHIIFRKEGGVDIELDGRNLRIIRSVDVSALLT